MDIKPNPAQRLYEIIKSAKAIKGNPGTLSGWIEVFKLSSNSLEENGGTFAQKVNEFRHRQEEMAAMSCLSKLVVLVNDVEEILKGKSEETYKLFRPPLMKIREAIIPSRFNEGFSATLARIDESDISLLHCCAIEISKFYSEKIISEKELGKLIKEIDKLYSDIKKSNLDNRLKILLLDLLKTMENSIHEYEIRGIKSVDDATAYLIGKMLINKDLVKDNEKNESVISFGKILAKFVSLWAFASDSFGNIEGVSKHIPLLPGYIEKAKEIGRNILN